MGRHWYERAWGLLAAGAMSVGLISTAGAQSFDGALDPSFGDPQGNARSGRTTFYFATAALPPLGSAQPAYTDPIKVLAQADGSLVVVSNIVAPLGWQDSSTYVIAVSRFARDGQPVRSFGIDGTVFLDEGEDFDSEAADAVLDTQGNLYIVGTVFAPVNRADMAVWKLDVNGQRVAGFGSNGLRRAMRGGTPDDRGRAIAFGRSDVPDNANLLNIAGETRNADGRPRVAMILMSSTDGQLCPVDPLGAYCGNVVGGDVGLSTAWGMFEFGLSNCLGHDDIIVRDLAGYLIFGSQGGGVRMRVLLNSPCLGADQALVAGLVHDINGSRALQFDTGFAPNGLRQAILHENDFQYSGSFGAALAFGDNAPADMSTYVVGYTARTDGRIAAGVRRFDSPTAWQNAGIKTFDFTAQPGFPSGAAGLNDIAVLDDGSLVLAGGMAASSFQFGDAFLARLLPNGDFDPRFGNLGASTGRAIYGHPFEIAPGNFQDYDNRVASLALSPDRRSAFITGFVYARDSANPVYRYGSVMKIKLDGALFADGFE